MTINDLRAGSSRLGKRLEELNGFDARRMTDRRPSELIALETGIARALAKTFGDDTADYRQFAKAASLTWSPGVFIGGHPTPLSEYQEGTARKIDAARAVLAEAIKTLEEDINDAESEEVIALPSAPAALTALSRKVFVVHGHDQGVREIVARFLERIGLAPIILHEQANQGRTVIEKVEAHGDVGFAVVLLTPDDEGCVKGGTLEPRARQNVLLELGYFIGRLGRAKVCALKRGALDIPSDFAGVVWEAMDDAGGWKSALGRELQAAGHEVDWNKVMQS